ncbi:MULTISPECIES: UrcA family protein [Henriciella]|jgi:UrcA family protein|uniref:UrcA family protein n=1 Tax=Henriciella pelagia TaxID=1977912 RepID=A0ABQ1JJQ5_9PROT|nr:UrcA family protein [Henriciella pelagia]GGB70734.1 hypothetical protein GCM10011503_19300 [Henriciella pelagia]
MKKRVSSILFALSIFGGVAHAEEFTEVNATLTFDTTLLDSQEGATEVLASLEKQAAANCRKVSGVSIGLVVDEVCAQDILFQAVNQIADPELTAAYSNSELFVETVSDRIQLAGL